MAGGENEDFSLGHDFRRLGCCNKMSEMSLFQVMGLSQRCRGWMLLDFQR